MSQEKKKKKKWIKFRHKVVRVILGPPVRLLCMLKYGIKIESFKGRQDRPYLILYNHQTAFDQFFVGLAFRKPVYYMASEDLFSNGALSSLIKYLVEPIPIKKQTTDVRAILNCMRVGKEGGSIAIAPEGNRTYSGEPVHMNETISSLARKLGMPIILYHIEGGYGVQPRWSDVTRRGGMRAYAYRVIEPEEYLPLSDKELYTLIREGLNVNEANADKKYFHKKQAEYLERAIYVCPKCGLSTFESHDDIISCKKCGIKVRHLPSKELVGLNYDLPYRFVLDWYNAQNDFINNLDLAPLCDKPIYDEIANLREEIPYKKKLLLKENTAIRLYGDRIEIDYEDGMILPFDEISTVTVLGRNKLDIYHGGRIFQLKGDKRFCALKYMHIYHRYKNIKKGDENDLFLGI